MGDGNTSMAVTGVGFTPGYVRIWQQGTAPDQAPLSIFDTTPEMIDDNARGMAMLMVTSVASRDDAVISLDADGFTVDDNGSNSHPNASGIGYRYLAIG